VRIRDKKETGKIPVSSIMENIYLPRKNEITAPRIPITAKPRITKPIGMREPVSEAVPKSKVASGAG
jgi:hypothetical protein